MEFSLKDLGLVDAPPAQEYDNLAHLATQLIRASLSLVSVVDFDSDRPFFKGRIDLPEPWATEQQTPLSHSFCEHVVCNAPEGSLVKDNRAIPDWIPVITVSAKVSPNGRGNKISITDSGIGIEAEGQEKAFNLFDRLHMREERPGTGVGLAPRKRIRLNQNGTLNVNSTHGESTVFTANLPRQST